MDVVAGMGRTRYGTASKPCQFVHIVEWTAIGRFTTMRNPTFMNQIEMLRLSKSPPLRQADLAERLGCAQSDISDFENGKRLPALPEALALAAILGVRVEELFFDLNERVLWLLGEQSRAAPEGGDGDDAS